MPKNPIKWILRVPAPSVGPRRDNFAEQSVSQKRSNMHLATVCRCSSLPYLFVSVDPRGRVECNPGFDIFREIFDNRHDREFFGISGHNVMTDGTESSAAQRANAPWCPRRAPWDFPARPDFSCCHLLGNKQQRSAPVCWARASLLLAKARETGGRGWSSWRARRQGREPIPERGGRQIGTQLFVNPNRESVTRSLLPDWADHSCCLNVALALFSMA